MAGEAAVGAEKAAAPALVVHSLRQRPVQPRQTGSPHVTMRNAITHPQLRAMTRSVRPWCIKRKTSLIRRIDNL